MAKKMVKIGSGRCVCVCVCVYTCIRLPVRRSPLIPFERLSACHLLILGISMLLFVRESTKIMVSCGEVTGMMLVLGAVFSS